LALSALGRRPDLWTTAAFEAVSLVPPGWWRRWPPVPVVSPKWLAFRMETAYGDPDARPTPADIVAFLDWCRMTRPRAWLR